jgi:hypothetical protein
MGFRTSQVARSTPFDNTGNGFTSTEVQGAIVEARDTASGKVRFAIPLINNSTLSNNQRIGYSELLPSTPVIVPRACILRELTFTNQSATADGRIDIYRRGTPASTNATTGATLLQQWTFTNALSAVLSGMAHSFAAGEEILLIYIDTGDNPSDACVTAFFEVS